MIELLLNVLALGVASAMQPGIFLVAMAILAGKLQPKERAFAYLGGAVLTAIIVLAAGVAVGFHLIAIKNMRYVGMADVALGALMLAFFAWSVRQIIRGRRGEASALKGFNSVRPATWFFLGFVLNITNFDAVLFYFTETKEIVQAGISAVAGAGLEIIATLLFLTPTLLPLTTYLAMPKRFGRAMRPVGSFMEKYGMYIVAAIFLIIGIYLFHRGWVVLG